MNLGMTGFIAMNPPRKHSETRPRASLVLVVDDSPDTRAVYRGVFFAEGILVEEAGDGIRAIAKALLCRPDVIVLDYCMPRMDGGETLQLLARDPRTKGIPVILATGSPSDVPVEARVLAAAIIAKPCDPDDIVEAVRALVPRAKPAGTYLWRVK